MAADIYQELLNHEIKEIILMNNCVSNGRKEYIDALGLLNNNVLYFPEHHFYPETVRRWDYCGSKAPLSSILNGTSTGKMDLGEKYV